MGTTATVGVECFLIDFHIFKGLFLLSLITGFCSQWEHKGSLSWVSYLTQLINPLGCRYASPGDLFFTALPALSAAEGIHLRW